ncbi:hypothetical protein MTO96_029954 [Rhipicephalus appendiculatus]
MKEAVSAADDTTSISSSNDDVGKHSTVQPDQELPRECQPPLISPVTHSSAFSSVENGMEEAVSAADDTSISSSNDDVGKLSTRQPERELPREKVLTGPDTAACQPPLTSPVTDSSAFSLVNGTEEAVSAADGSTSISSSNDDVSKLPTMQPEQELPREKLLTGLDTAACQPALTSPVTDSLPFSFVQKNGEEEAIAAKDSSTSISSSNDDVGKLCSTQPERELQKEKVLTYPDTAACQPPLTSPVADSSAFSSIEKNGMEEAAAAAGDATSISSNNDDVGKLSTTQPERELPREYVVTGPDTATCQPQLTSPVTDSSAFSLVEKNGMEEAVSAADDTTSISSSNDNVGKHSTAQPEQELPRECQPPLISLGTDSSAFSSIEKSGMEEAVSAADDASISSSNDDVGKLSTTLPDRELPRETVVTGPDTAACQPQLTSPVTDSSAFSLDNGTEKAVSAANDLTSISSSSDDVGKLSSMHQEQELQKEKVLTDPDTAACQPQLTSPVTDSSAFFSLEKNGMEEALSAADDTTSMSSSNDDVGKHSTAQPEQELPRECQPPLISLGTDSSAFSSIEKSGMEEAESAADDVSISSSNDDVGKLSTTLPERERPRPKVLTGPDTATCQPQLTSPVTDSSAFSLDNGTEKAVSAANDLTSISSSSDDVDKLSSTQQEQELQKEKVLTDPDTAACQPPLTSPVTDSLAFFSFGKNGMEEAVSAADDAASISSSNDDVSKLSSMQPERERPRPKVLTGPDTAACQPQLTSPVTDSLAFFSIGKNGMEEAVSAADDAASISSSNDDVSKLSSMQPERERPRPKVLTGPDTAACQPQLTSPVTDSLAFFSFGKNGMEEAVSAADDAASISSSNDDVSKLSSMQPERERPRPKVLTGLDTAACQPQLTSPVTDSLAFFSFGKNGMEEAVSAADDAASISSSNDDVSKLSSMQPERERPRPKVLTGPDTAACQPQLTSPVTDSLAFFSIGKNGMVEAVSAADDATSISSSNDDIGKLSTTQPERELPREEVLTGLDTAACQPPLNSPKTDSLAFFSIEKNGEKEAVSATDGWTSILSRNDDDASSLSNIHPGHELPKGKVSTGSDTATSQLPPNYGLLVRLL